MLTQSQCISTSQGRLPESALAGLGGLSRQRTLYLCMDLESESPTSPTELPGQSHKLPGALKSGMIAYCVGGYSGEPRATSEIRTAPDREADVLTEGKK